MLLTLKLENLKSIISAEIAFTPLNVLIGANGSGKSNLVGFFRLLQSLVHGELQAFISANGGSKSLLRREDDSESLLHADLSFQVEEGTLAYSFSLSPVLNALVFSKEIVSLHSNGPGTIPKHVINLGSGHQESVLSDHEAKEKSIQDLLGILERCQFYQFHDTSAAAAIRQGSSLERCHSLQSDGGNLPAYLYFLRQNYPDYFIRIVETVRLVFPHFREFILREAQNGYISLAWIEEEKGILFDAHQLSDGTLRFVALATLLLQPDDLLPHIILIDEPELGLHPFAVRILSSMIEGAAERSQIILATQSVEIVDSIDPNSIIVAERPEHETIFRRLEAAQYADWLQDYSLGDLWKKNVIGGRPSI